jgi:hypothetical protein
MMLLQGRKTWRVSRCDVEPDAEKPQSLDIGWTYFEFPIGAERNPCLNQGFVRLGQ